MKFLVVFATLSLFTLGCLSKEPSEPSSLPHAKLDLTKHSELEHVHIAAHGAFLTRSGKVDLSKERIIATQNHFITKLLKQANDPPRPHVLHLTRMR